MTSEHPEDRLRSNITAFNKMWGSNDFRIPLTSHPKKVDSFLSGLKVERTSIFFQRPASFGPRSSLHQGDHIQVKKIPLQSW